MLALESFLLDEPSVEAIRLDPASKKSRWRHWGVWMASCSKRSSRRGLRTIDAKWLKQVPEHTRMFDVSQSGSVMQIEKPSCPTAPTFWEVARV